MYCCPATVSVPLHASICEANFREQLPLRNEKNVILQVLPWKLKIEHRFCIAGISMTLKQLNLTNVFTEGAS